MRRNIADIVSQLPPFLRKKVIDKAREIATISEPYRWRGKDFTFDSDPALDTAVNTALVELSDEVMDYIGGLVHDAVRDMTSTEEMEEAEAYSRRIIGNEDLVERTDKYCTHLRFFLEAYIAIAFANNLGLGELMTRINMGIADPFASPFFTKAYLEGGYRAKVITDGGFRYGPGVQRNIINALALVGTQAVNSALQLGTILEYRHNPAIIGYRVHRNSTFDCPTCDELCIGIHPLTELVLPAHPRCVCYTTPVFADDIIP